MLTVLVVCLFLRDVLQYFFSSIQNPYSFKNSLENYCK
jgi:hypothetical protein